MTACLQTLLPELLQHIAYHVAVDSFFGPPPLLSFQLSCKQIYAALAFDNAPYLYDRIFRAKFDLGAPVRRLGREITRSTVLAHELRKRCYAMRRIRRCDIYSEHVLHDLWLAYLMMLESDGKNDLQLLLWADVGRYAMRFVVERLYEGSESHNGWPIETDASALAVWLLWLSSNSHSTQNEPHEVWAAVLTIFQPFMVAAFKYQTFLVPDTHFALPINGSPSTNPPRCQPTPHGYYPIYRPPLSPDAPAIAHFGLPLALCAPPLVPAALLLCYTRRQRGRMMPRETMWLRRADRPPGELGATVEDVDEYNAYALTRHVPRRLDASVLSRRCEFTSDCALEGATPPLGSHRHPRAPPNAALLPPTSLQHEHDWLRLTHCYNPWLDAKIKIRIYTPGMIDGLWEGRKFIYAHDDYAALVSSPNMPAQMSAAYPPTYQKPVYMRLREHHCLHGNLPIGWGQDDFHVEADALSCGWFPPGVDLVETGGNLHIFDPNGGERLKYETYVPGRPNSHAAAGGCPRCNPEDPLPAATLREQERIFQEEFGMERWEDSVNDGCITDIVITGEPDPEHESAWGFYRFIGRVRDADGLVILLRIPLPPTSLIDGTFIFRGYIHSNQNFVGRWRYAADPTNFASVEGSFSLTKRQ